MHTALCRPTRLDLLMKFFVYFFTVDKKRVRRVVNLSGQMYSLQIIATVSLLPPLSCITALCQDLTSFDDSQPHGPVKYVCIYKRVNM